MQKRVYKYKIFAIFILSLFCLYFCMPICVMAADMFECNICGVEHDVSDLSFSQKLALEWNDMVYGGDWFNEKDKESSITTIAALEFSTTGPLAGIWGLAEGYYNALAPAGIILCVTYALMELMELSTTDQMSPETILRTILKLGLGCLLILNGFTICSFIMALGSDIFTQLQSATSSLSNKTCIYGELRTPSFCDGMLAMSELFIPYLIVWIAKMIISIICWIRVLNIMVRILLAPIGMSDILVAGTKGSGWKYFKQLSVSIIQGGVIMAIIMCNSIIIQIAQQANQIETLVPYMITIMCTILTLVAIVKSQSYAQDLVV